MTTVRAVYLEALHIDPRNWDAWLALYLPDCTFWVPSWRDENSQVEDPEAEISFIYASSRKVLAWRSSRPLRTRPLPWRVDATPLQNVDFGNAGEHVRAALAALGFPRRSDGPFPPG